MSAAGVSGPCCPTCGGPAPAPRPIDTRHETYSACRVFALASELLASYPPEDRRLVMERRLALLDATDPYRGRKKRRKAVLPPPGRPKLVKGVWQWG